MTKKEAPESAAERRPGGKPYYIDEHCPDCGEELVYYHTICNDVLMDESNDMAPNLEHRQLGWEPFYDEFTCPMCLNGLHMDWPESHKNEVFGRINEAIEDINEGNFVTLEELEESLDLKES